MVKIHKIKRKYGVSISGRQLPTEARIIVYNVANYLKVQKQKHKLEYNVIESASDATGVSKSLVNKVLNEAASGKLDVNWPLEEKNENSVDTLVKVEESLPQRSIKEEMCELPEFETVKLEPQEFADPDRFSKEKKEIDIPIAANSIKLEPQAGETAMEIELKEQVISLEHQVSLLSQSVAELREVKENLSRDQNVQEVRELCQELHNEREQRIRVETELQELKQKFETELSNEQQRRLELEQQCAELNEQISQHNSNEDEMKLYRDRYECIFEFLKSAPCNSKDRAISAVKSGNSTIVKILLDMDFDVDTKYEGGLTLLHCAAMSGNLETIKLLVKHGAHVNAKDNNGRTPLHEAARCGYDEACSYLISVGARVNQGTNKLESPLHKAAQKGHLEVCRVLLNSGANVNICERYNYTPLHEAARSGHLPVVKLLLKRNANGTLKTDGGRTVYSLACIHGHQEIAEYFSSFGLSDDSAT